MGFTSYDASFRAIRATTEGYHIKSASEIFTQIKKREIHTLMDPHGLTKREARDSEAHPNTVPIIVALDLTGSMGHIPHDLIKDGLPTMMSGMIQKGVKDATVCFIGVGDHEVDRAPLQVGQFESGDAELDTWLTRTWPEGGGGGNAGESYHLAWLFAAQHTVIDSFEKRGKKGFLFTIGDEPCLDSLSASDIEHFLGYRPQKNFTAAELLKEAQKMYNVYHINVIHGGRNETDHWTQKLGKNCLNVRDYTTIPTVIADTVVNNCEDCIGMIPIKTYDAPTDHEGDEGGMLL